MLSNPQQLQTPAILLRANTSPFERYDRLPRSIAAALPWGPTLAATAAGAAARYPNRDAIIDEDDSITYRALWRQARNVAAGLGRQGVGRRSTVGLLARNRISFVVSLIGASATGARVVLMNTGFGGPQLADVVEHERVDTLIVEPEFAALASACAALDSPPRVLTTADIDDLARHRSTPRVVRHQGDIIVLTSGTTGRPKGASRESAGPAQLAGVAAVYERVPLRLGDVQVVPAPFFHAWGLTMLLLGISRCTTTITSARFDPVTTLTQLSGHRARVLIAVPVMMARIVDLPDVVFSANPVSNLSIIATSGSALGPRLASDILDRFGPVLYNLYGSTEVAVATIANPADLTAEPATAGRPAFGVDVAVLGPDGQRLPEGRIGRVFVGGVMRFNGYTNGTTKEQIGGLLSTGDLGVFRSGRLFIEGREDDMIVSGGENVYPIEVEELLADLPEVSEAAVVGVPDEEFGQVLSAFVVLRDGASLSADEIKEVVKAKLARHKVPRHITFLDELPRNATGKVLRRSLAES